MDQAPEFLTKAVDNELILFLEHDIMNECATLQHTEKGVRLKDTFRFKDLF